jgi:hypothetical protein
MYRIAVSCVLTLGMGVAQALGQNATPPTSPKTSQAQGAGSDKGTTEPAKTTPLAVSRAQRLGAAKSAFIRKVEGSDIPVNVITNSMEGWGRYALVNSADKADLLIEISSPEEQPSSITVKGSHINPLTGYPDQSTTTTRNISSMPIKLTVFDAKSKLPLWTAVEQPKRALKQKSREDNLVEAAEALFSKFHEVVEPSAP